ncbi:MAG: hypothetical protein ACKVS6_15780 [Planctomycetota bacterium]
MLRIIFACFAVSFAGFQERAVRPASGVSNLCNFLPADSIAYFEVSNPGALLEKLKKSAVPERVQSLPSYQQNIKTGEGLRFITGIAALRAALGIDLEPAFHGAFGRGIAASITKNPKPGPPHALLVSRAGDPTVLLKVRDALAEFAQVRSFGEWHEGPVQVKKKNMKQFGDVEIVGTGEELFHAIAGDLLFISNHRASIEAALDRFELTEAPLMKNDKFAGAIRSFLGRDVIAWFDFEQFTKLYAPNLRERETMDEPFPALLVGGVKQAFLGSAWLAGSLQFNGSSVDVTLDTSALPELSKATFIPDIVNIPNINVRRQIGTFTIRRDVNAFWNDHEGIVLPELDAEFSKFNTTAATIFGVRRMDEDVFPKLTPVSHFIVARQSYSNLPKAPKVKIPAFAVLLQVKEDSKKITEGFRRAFQTAIALSAADAAQKGRAALGLTEETVGEQKIYYSTYPDPEEDEEVALEYNFSPAFCSKGNYLIVSSTHELARDVILQLPAAPRTEVNVSEPAKASSTLDELYIHGPEAMRALDENSAGIIANAMLENGKSKAQASRELAGIVDLASLVRSAAVRSVATPSGMQFQLKIDLEPGPVTPAVESRPRK